MSTWLNHSEPGEQSRTKANRTSYLLGRNSDAFRPSRQKTKSNGNITHLGENQLSQSPFIRRFEIHSLKSQVLASMAPFHANNLIDALADPKTGDAEKELSLLFLGVDLLDLDERLEESWGKTDEVKGSKSDQDRVHKLSPWWKLW